MALNRDLTQGSIPKGLLAFALPLILGNLLQQLYNLADTWVVGQFLGEGTLAAVGSSYTSAWAAACFLPCSSDEKTPPDSGRGSFSRSV